MENKFDAAILKKLRVSPSARKLVVNAPPEIRPLVAEMGCDTEYDAGEAGKYDFVQVFGANQEELVNLLQRIAGAGKYDAVFWACYPKGGGRIKGDLKREAVWAALELISLRAVSQVALDDTWSALRGRPHAVVNSTKGMPE